MNNLFLANKEDNREYQIFDITYDQSGYPQFLVYKDGQWLRMSAKHFTPYYDVLESLAGERIVWRTRK